MADPPFEAPKPVDNRGIDPVKQMDAAARDALFKQLQLGQELKKTERSNPNILDLGGEAGYSALYSGVQSPITSIGQIADNFLDNKSKIAEIVTVLPAPEQADFGTKRWVAQQVGGAGGMILPFMLTKGAIGKAGLSFEARTEASVLASSRLMSTANAGLIADGAISGFAYDFLLRPVEQKDMGNFWTARTNHGLTGAATFGTLTAGSVGLRGVTRSWAATLAESSKPVTLAYDFTMGALPGIPAGIVNADVNARLTEGRWATGEERAKGALTMIVAGGGLSALHSLPGSKVPLGDVARAYASRRAGINNLNDMLAERAREAKAGETGDGKVPAPSAKATAPDTPPATGDSKMTGTARTEKSGSAEAARGDVKPGRTMAGADTEVMARPLEGDFEVSSPELKATLQKGVDLAFKASDPDCTPQQVVEFFKFARGEGAPVKGPMMEVAKAYADDPRMMTLIREAYLPPEGVEHRVVDEVKIKTPDATTNQFARWGQFLQIIREMPQDVDGYVNFRHDVFRWLNENKDLHDWARQYGEQNRYSKIAGPLDYYFGTSNLGRFVEAADAKAASDAAAGSRAKSAVDAPPVIRLDLTAAEAKHGSADGATDASGVPLLDINAIGFVAGRTTDGKAAADPYLTTRATESAPRPTGEPTMEQRLAVFDRPPSSRQKIDAMALSENFGQMTTEQFAKWLDYAYAKPAGATDDGASNLRSMWIPNREALLSPEVAEAYKQYRHFGDPPVDGQPPAVPLEAVRQFLSAPKAAEAQPLPTWLNDFVEARIEIAKQTAKPDAKPHEVLDAALPRWLVDGLRQQHTVDAKIAGQPPTYKATLPPELAQWMEAARQTQPPKQVKPGGRPEREPKPIVNDAGFRLGKLNEIMAIDDPIIRDNLLRLGTQDPNAVRSIVGKLDPTRSAPEYRELLRMVLPKAESAGDVKLLLDALFFGNKNHYTDSGSQLTKSHQQLAMAVAEHIVPQSDPNFERTQQMVDQFITGKIRDPRPPRFGEERGGPGGRDGGRPGDPKKDGALVGGARPGGPASPRTVAAPRPPQELTIKDSPPPAAASAKPPVAADAKPPVAADAKPPVAADAKPPVATDAKPPVTASADFLKPPAAADAKPPIAADAKPPVVADTKPPVAADAKPPVAADAKPPVAADAKPPVAADAKPPVAADAKPPVAADAKPPVAADAIPPVATDAKPPVAADAIPPLAADAKPPDVVRDANPAPSIDILTLRNGQKIKVNDQAAVFVGSDAQSAEPIVRIGKIQPTAETFHTAKIFGKLKLQEVVGDKSTNRKLYRDGEGKFFEVKQHGAGYMVSERPEYHAVKPSDIK